MGFTGSDLWKVRQKWGNGPLVWPGVTVLALNADGQVLLGRRVDNDRWSVIGGYYELDDSAESCAQREVLEETGLEIAELRMFGVITDPKITRFTYTNGDEVQSPSHVFMALIAVGDARAADDEHSAFQWFDFAEAKLAVASGYGYSAAAFEMYEQWIATGEFQVR